MDNHHYLEEGTASDSEDTLSLCDLSFPDNNPQDALPCPNNSPSEDEVEDSFNFSANPNQSTLSPIDSLLFFGKSMPCDGASVLQYTKEDQDEGEKHQRSRISLFRSDSFNRPFISSFRHEGVKTEKFIADYYGRFNSVRLANKSDASSTVICSENSRKYKALIGPTMFPAKMELNEIRRRQSRLPPAPMFAAATNGIGGKSLWRLVRPLRSRSHMVSALARASLGCIPRMEHTVD